MSDSDVQWWSLVIGLGVFVSIVAALFVGRRARERRNGPDPSPGEFVVNRRPVASTPEPSLGAASPRRRPAPPPPTGGAVELTSAVRSAIQRAVAERTPAGWTALLLSPPPHPDGMTWHVHLVPEVALDLADGRTISAAAPLPSYEWELAGGRTVSIAEGDPEPAPTHQTTTVRVTGPYLHVVVTQNEGQQPVLVARVVQSSEEALPLSRAVATDARAVQGALRQSIELTVGTRVGGSPPTVGYPIGSWAAHDRTWLTVGR